MTLVKPSVWPLLMALSVLYSAFGLVSWLVLARGGLFILGPMVIVWVGLFWWRDLLREGEGGDHTLAVQRGLSLGVLFFLLSEVMLFMSFFWAFFHSSLSPTIELGATWPPSYQSVGEQCGIERSLINPWSIPLLNSCILLYSGFTLTLAHHCCLGGEKDRCFIAMALTIVLAILFIGFQSTELTYGELTIADSVFGSVFYLTTGLHALHVLIGLIMLTLAAIPLST